MSRHVVATAAEIGPGERKLVTVRGRPIAIFNLDGEYFGLLNRCPHQGGPICEGKITGLIQASEPGKYLYSKAGEIIRCPWHAWEFNIRTGQSYAEPDRIRTRAYPVEVAAGATLAEGPYVAEKIAVHQEEQYLIVDL